MSAYVLCVTLLHLMALVRPAPSDPYSSPPPAVPPPIHRSIPPPQPISYRALCDISIFLSLCTSATPWTDLPQRESRLVVIATLW